MENIEFNSNTPVFLAERVIRVFSNKIFKILAQIVLVFGAIYLFVFLWNLLDPELLKSWNPGARSILTFFFSISIFAFMGTAFFQLKLSKILPKAPLSSINIQVRKINFAEYVDLEAAKVLSKSVTGSGTLNLYSFFKEAIKSNRGSFVLNKLGLVDEGLNSVVESKKETTEQEFKKMVS